jgi:hypothetical protein
MLESPPDKRQEPRTLHEAKTIIANLRRQLAGHGPPVGALARLQGQPSGLQPVPPLPERPPQLPGPTLPVNPNNLTPKALAAHMEGLSESELLKVMRKEPGDSPAFHAAGKEFKRRR